MNQTTSISLLWRTINVNQDIGGIEAQVLMKTIRSERIIKKQEKLFLICQIIEADVFIHCILDGRRNAPEIIQQRNLR